MVDIGEKKHVYRKAKASGYIKLLPGTISRIRKGELPKGDVLSVARTAGVMAIKNTTDIIPLTHPIPIKGANIDFEVQEEGVKVEAEVKSRGQTGVEMEALSGVMASLLTVWDMVKGFEKDDEGQYPDTRITDVKVTEKVKNDHN